MGRLRQYGFFFLLTFTCCIVAASPAKPVTAKHAMVVSEHELASRVGNAILLAGGNAFDAAAAVGYALAVVQPCCGNIGGGGFALLHTAQGKYIFLNFREKSPLAARANMFLNKKGQVIPNLSTRGYLAVAVPGTVLGLEFLREKYGTMSRYRVMKPAIDLAEHGFVLNADDVQTLNKYKKELQAQPNVARIFFKANGASYQVGDKLIQKDLANTLKLIADQGTKSFYAGKITQEILRASKQNGGILTSKDFKNFTIQEKPPLSCTYQDYIIMTAALPSSGGITVCEMLNILEAYPLKKLGWHTLKSTHYIVEAMRYAFYDRNHLLGDPDFVSNPTEKLLSKDYAEQIRQQILDVKATPSSELKEHTPRLNEKLNTTHYSIVDKFGNVASVTYTLNSNFGAKVIAGKTGFFLNNEMDDFTTKLNTPNQFGLIEGTKNKIIGGKRPLSSMMPTIILKHNKIFMVLGSPGGPRIITSNLLTILNVINYEMNIQQAVNMPRYHHQWLPDVIYYEANAFSAQTRSQLNDMGYDLKINSDWGAVESIMIHHKNKQKEGANDKRRPDGLAIGN